jgi:ketosteroid isomerase-like protein
LQDADKNQVAVWATSQTKFHEEVKDAEVPEDEWQYKGEYMFLLNVDDSEEKIERVVEFVDSKGTEGLCGLMQRARLNKAELAK